MRAGLIPSPAGRRDSRTRGSALIMVLWLAFGLVTLSLYFGHSMVLEMRASQNVAAGAQADQAIEGAARYLTYLLDNLEKPGVLPALNDYSNEGVAIGEATFFLVGSDPNQADRTRLAPGLVDEAGKLNLNTATSAMLALLPGMDTTLAAAIVDWRDSNDDISENGAESETYGRLRPAYRAKNGRFETVDELRLVSGMTELVLLGEDLNRNGILDPNENDGEDAPPTDNRDGNLDLGLLDLVTVYSAEPNTRTNGEPRVVVGQGNGNRQDLVDVLTEGLGGDRANEVAGRLNNGTFDSMVTVFQRSGLSLTEFGLIDDDLTISTNQVTEGLINVNTAPVEVLACLPGLERADAEALVAYRTSNPSQLTSVAWVTEVLDGDKLRTAAPLMTDKGYQYLADIVAVGRAGRGYRRSRMIFDLTEEMPTVIYRQDASRFGWALGTQWREQLLAQREVNQNP